MEALIVFIPKRTLFIQSAHSKRAAFDYWLGRHSFKVEERDRYPHAVPMHRKLTWWKRRSEVPEVLVRSQLDARFSVKSRVSLPRRVFLDGSKLRSFSDLRRRGGARFDAASSHFAS